MKVNPNEHINSISNDIYFFVSIGFSTRPAASDTDSYCYSFKSLKKFPLVTKTPLTLFLLLSAQQKR